MTPQEWVGLIVERAGELRAAGVQSISVDGASVTLLPSDGGLVATGKVPPGPVDEPLLHPLDDPETFGGVLPGYTFPVSQPGAIE
jgi:hypothetical protein